MGQIETTTTTKKFPVGGKIVKQAAISPVMVTRVRTVGMDKQTVELQLEQMFEPPVGSQGGILALTMAGHSAFNSGPRKRLTWQNFSVIQAVKFGVIRSWEEVAGSEGPLTIGGAPTKGVMIFPQGKKLTILDSKNQEIPLKLVEVETFTPRTWTDRNTGKPMVQRPKQAGQDGDLLTFNGQAIYRNSGLSMPGAGDTFVNPDGSISERAWDEDLVIVHNNQIVGSSVRQAMGKVGIELPKVPGTPSGRGGVHTDGTGSLPLEPNAQQNAPIGDTRTNTGPVGEPNRHNPDEQLVEVGEKTQAEQQREDGERDYHAGQQ